jgi:hypothetical protein
MNSQWWVSRPTQLSWWEEVEITFQTQLPLLYPIQTLANPNPLPTITQQFLLKYNILRREKLWGKGVDPRGCHLATTRDCLWKWKIIRVPIVGSYSWIHRSGLLSRVNLLIQLLSKMKKEYRKRSLQWRFQRWAIRTNHQNWLSIRANPLI